MEWKAKWIKPSSELGDVCPVFSKRFIIKGKVKQAKLSITVLGVYETELNGKRVGEYILAPGWTSYNKRLQYQEYDVTKQIEEENQLLVTVGKGWYRGLSLIHI